MPCHYAVYRLTCNLFSTLVAVFQQESTFRNYSCDAKYTPKNNRPYYQSGEIYGPASGFVIRSQFDGKPISELKKYMKRIGGYKEELLT